MTLKNLLTQQGYVSIPLTSTITQHFEIQAKINGIEGKFILDTGASNTCLGLESIEHFGLETEFSEIKASGAGASEMETQISKKNNLEIGKWKCHKIAIVLFDLTHVNYALIQHNALPVHGIIGADVLKMGKAIIDYPKKKLYLK
ncbi:MAG: retropepsin-like aspartic protease [Capnocytophaga sp.]|nr:retropepsin-like aspartic protease [Capnocytophaga sp.]